MPPAMVEALAVDLDTQFITYSNTADFACTAKYGWAIRGVSYYEMFDSWVADIKERLQQLIVDSDKLYYDTVLDMGRSLPAIFWARMRCLQSEYDKIDQLIWMLNGDLEEFLHFNEKQQGELHETTC